MAQEPVLCPMQGPPATRVYARSQLPLAKLLSPQAGRGEGEKGKGGGGRQRLVVAGRLVVGLSDWEVGPTQYWASSFLPIERDLGKPSTHEVTQKACEVQAIIMGSTTKIVIRNYVLGKVGRHPAWATHVMKSPVRGTHFPCSNPHSCPPFTVLSWVHPGR